MTPAPMDEPSAELAGAPQEPRRPLPPMRMAKTW